MRIPHYRHTGFAWLAIAGLLISVLLPTAVFVGAAGGSQATASGFCGAARGGSMPGDQPSMPTRQHCVYCLVAAVGPALAPPAVPVLPQFRDNTGSSAA